MKNKFAKIKKEADEEITKRRYKRDNDGRIVINMNVKDDSTFLSVFSENAIPVISTDVAEFIESRASATPINEEFTLRISSNCIDDEEKAIYKNAIHEYYIQKYISNEQEHRRNRFIVVLLSFIGVLVLALSVAFDYFIGNQIWSEVIDIVAWVLIWEAVDIGVFENRILRFKKNRYLAFLSMKTEYISEE